MKAPNNESIDDVNEINFGVGHFDVRTRVFG